jgi:uncharacterized membrane protein YheB (UPF0754 family)
MPTPQLFHVMAALASERPAPELESVLHPAFEEDEIQLIVLGGLLGTIVGVIQLFIHFS